MHKAFGFRGGHQICKLGRTHEKVGDLLGYLGERNSGNYVSTALLLQSASWAVWSWEAPLLSCQTCALAEAVQSCAKGTLPVLQPCLSNAGFRACPNQEHHIHMLAVYICQEVRGNNIQWRQGFLLRASVMVTQRLSGWIFVSNSWLLYLFESLGGRWSPLCQSIPVGKTASKWFLVLQAAQ